MTQNTTEKLINIIRFIGMQRKGGGETKNKTTTAVTANSKKNVLLLCIKCVYCLGVCVQLQLDHYASFIEFKSNGLTENRFEFFDSLGERKQW